MALRLNLSKKDEPKVLVGVRVYESTRDALSLSAAAEGVSVQQLVVTLINNHLEENNR